MKLILFFAAFLLLFTSHPSTAGSLKIGEIYKSLNAKHTIEIISVRELKITRGDKTISASYKVNQNTLSVEVSYAQSKRIKNFKIIAEGLKEVKMGGHILYSRGKYKMGLLRQGARTGDIEAVKSLIAGGLDPNVKTGKGSTALMLAASKGHANIANLLIESGADVNAKNKYGTTALKLAKKKGHKKIVEILKNAGAKE